MIRASPASDRRRPERQLVPLRGGRSTSSWTGQPEHGHRPADLPGQRHDLGGRAAEGERRLLDGAQRVADDQQLARAPSGLVGPQLQPGRPLPADLPADQAVDSRPGRRCRAPVEPFCPPTRASSEPPQTYAIRRSVTVTVDGRGQHPAAARPRSGRAGRPATRSRCSAEHPLAGLRDQLVAAVEHGSGDVVVRGVEAVRTDEEGGRVLVHRHDLPVRLAVYVEPRRATRSAVMTPVRGSAGRSAACDR